MRRCTWYSGSMHRRVVAGNLATSKRGPSCRVLANRRRRAQDGDVLMLSRAQEEENDDGLGEIGLAPQLL
jgi:hypothetical protein